MPRLLDLFQDRFLPDESILPTGVNSPTHSSMAVGGSKKRADHWTGALPEVAPEYLQVTTRG